MVLNTSKEKVLARIQRDTLVRQNLILIVEDVPRKGKFRLQSTSEHIKELTDTLP
jgi:hypothetical protein